MQKHSAFLPALRRHRRLLAGGLIAVVLLAAVLGVLGVRRAQLAHQRTLHALVRSFRTFQLEGVYAANHMYLQYREGVVDGRAGTELTRILALPGQLYGNLVSDGAREQWIEKVERAHPDCERLESITNHMETWMNALFDQASYYAEDPDSEEYEIMQAFLDDWFYEVQARMYAFAEPHPAYTSQEAVAAELLRWTEEIYAITLYTSACSQEAIWAYILSTQAARD